MSAATTTTKVNKSAKNPKPQEDPILKALKVKTGTLKRNVKDLDFALQEVAKEEARLQKITSDDPDKVKQQQNVIQESKMMIPLAENRIRSSLQELKDYLLDNGNEIPEGELKATAQQAIVDGDACLSTRGDK